MSNEMDEDDQLYESDQLTNFVSAVRKPVEEDLLEDQVQLLEHSVPMNKSYQFEVEDVAFLKGH